MVSHLLLLHHYKLLHLQSVATLIRNSILILVGPSLLADVPTFFKAWILQYVVNTPLRVWCLLTWLNNLSAAHSCCQSPFLPHYKAALFDSGGQEAIEVHWTHVHGTSFCDMAHYAGSNHYKMNKLWPYGGASGNSTHIGCSILPNNAQMVLRRTVRTKKHSLPHNTTIISRTCWCTAGWAHGFMYLTLNSDHTIHKS